MSSQIPQEFHRLGDFSLRIVGLLPLDGEVALVAVVFQHGGKRWNVGDAASQWRFDTAASRQIADTIAAR